MNKTQTILAAEKKEVLELLNVNLVHIWRKYERLREGSIEDRKKARRIYKIAKGFGIRFTPIGRRSRSIAIVGRKSWQSRARKGNFQEKAGC